MCICIASQYTTPAGEGVLNIDRAAFAVCKGPLPSEQCSTSKKKVINGCEYLVTAVTEDAVAVDMHPDYHTGNAAKERGVVLTHEEASEWLRLAYARCYYPTQGRAIRDAVVMLLDTRHPLKLLKESSVS